MPNGLKVASLDSDASAVSTVGILVKAGSSYENYDNLGVSHALRMATGLSSKNATSFGIGKIKSFKKRCDFWLLFYMLQIDEFF